MDITQFVEALRRDLSQAAEAGTDEVRAAAERLLRDRADGNGEGGAHG